MSRFLSYYPLKQGLKQREIASSREQNFKFLSYYPLKQGLKLVLTRSLARSLQIFILLSIKTRIETNRVNYPLQ